MRTVKNNNIKNQTYTLLEEKMKYKGISSFKTTYKLYVQIRNSTDVQEEQNGRSCDDNIRIVRHLLEKRRDIKVFFLLFLRVISC